MSAPSFPLVGGQTATSLTGTGAVTLALTPSIDPDNPLEGDLHLLNGQIHFWDGLAAERQKVIMLLRFVRGEWFLNTEEGVPYFTHILIKNPSSAVVKNLIRDAILSSPGIASVSTVNLAIDNASRTASITWTATTNTGETLDSTDFGPFLLGVP